MLVQALLLSTAVVASVLGAPTNCAEFCDDQAATSSGYGSAGQSHSSYSSYAKSSGYDHRLQRLSSSAGNLNAGSQYGRLENLDENVVSGSSGSGIGLNLDRPGNWQDEKHYVTDDGRGQMSYRAGQTVTGNGFSKFAEHSYSYGTHDSHAPLSNSQVLSASEFNQELQNMRQRIANFMGSFHLNAGSVVNANLIADFKSKANLINNQLTDVCNQVDYGSLMHQQMQQVQQKFNQDIEKLQHQMEQQMSFQSSSSSSSSSLTHHYQSAPTSRPTYVPSTPTSAPIQTYPSSRAYPGRTAPISEESLIQQRLVEEEITKVQQQVSSFYTNFNRPDADFQYQANFNSQADIISQKIVNLRLQALQNESLRARLDDLKSQFETYISQIRARIQEIEKRRHEEEVKLIEAEELEERKRYEESIRNIEQKKLRIKQQEEEAKRQREEAERKRLQEEEALRIREETERLKLKEEESRRQREEFERIQLEQQQQKLEEEARRQREQAERLQRQQVENIQIQQQAVQQPQVSGSLEVSSRSSYDHSIKAYGGQQQQQQLAAGGSYVSHAGQQQQASYVRPQPVLNAHVDLTAQTSRLQQELNRLQNEINNFNTYMMRLTSANSQTVIAEAEHKADSLRQSINNLCETSGRYQNQNIQTSAEELARRFEEMFRSLQSQAANYTASGGSSSGFAASAGYSSHSSYGSSGAVSSVRAPTITNVEYEHSKSAEVEISRRPVSGSSQRYASGQQQQQVECVEVYAGQPCVEQQPQQPRRYRRQVGDKYNPHYDSTQQRHQPVLDDTYQPSRNANPRASGSQLEEEPQLNIGPNFGVLSFGPKSRNPETEKKLEDFAQRIGSYGLPSQRHSPLGKPIQQQNRPVEDLTYQQGDSDDYYARHRSPEDLSQQQHATFGSYENLDSLQGPRGQNVDVTHRPRDKSRRPVQTESDLEILHAEDLREEKRPQTHAFEESMIGYDESRARPVASYKSDADFTLENSGFKNDDEKLRASTTPTIKFENNERLQQQKEDKPLTYEETLIESEQSKEKPGSAEDRFNLIKSDFWDNFSEKPEQVQTTEERTEERTESGFHENPNYNMRSELYGKNIQSLGEHSESEAGDFSHREIVENQKQSEFNGSEQTAGQVKLDSQLEGQLSSQDTFQPEPTSTPRETPLQSVSDKRRPKDHQIEHPAGRYIGNLHNHNQQSNVQQSPNNNQPDQPSYNIQDVFGDGPSDQLENVNSKAAITEHEESITTRPTTKPAPKPVPRYTRPWQVNRSNNVPEKALENESNIFENENVNVNQPTYPSHGFDNHSGPHRGDLPGHSEPLTPPVVEERFPETEEKPVTEKPVILVTSTQKPVVPTVTEEPTVEEKPVTDQDDSYYQRPNINYKFKLQHEQSVVRVNEGTESPVVQKSGKEWQHQSVVKEHEETESPNVQKLNNEWQENTSGLNLCTHCNEASSNQQKYHHKYQYSHQAKYYNQYGNNNNNNNYQYGQQSQEPLNQQNSYVQLNQQVKPIDISYMLKPIGFGSQIKPFEFSSQIKPTEFGHHQESSYNYQKYQKNNLELQDANKNLKPFEQSTQFQYSGQNKFGQQIQEPLIFQSSQLQSRQWHNSFGLENSNENSKNNYADNLTTLSGLPPIQPWSEIEPTSTQHTFWKRVGHKLSYSYDKAKDRARTIFG